MMKKYFVVLLLCLAVVPNLLAQTDRETITAENGNRLTEMMRLGRGTVDSLAFSPNGNTIAVASSAGTWLYAADALDTAEDPVLLLGKAATTALAFSPDGKFIATGEQEFVRVWDVAERTEVYALESSYWVESLAFSPDSTILAVGESDYVIRLWDMRDGKQIRAQEGHTSTIYDLEFNADGSLLASTGADGSIRLWDMSDGSEMLNLSSSYDYINSVAFSPDGETLVSAGDDDAVRIWDVKDGTELVAITEFADAEGEDLGYTENMNTVAFAPEGAVFAVGSDDDHVRIYNLDGEQQAIINTEYDVESLAFSPDGTQIATIGYDTTVALWDVASGEKIANAVGHSDDFGAVMFSPDSQTLIVGNSDGNAWLWDAAAPQPLGLLPVITQELSYSANNTTALVFAPDGSFVAFVDGFGVQIWEPDFSAERITLEADGLSNNLAISPDSRLLAYVGSQGVFVFDIATGDLLSHLSTHTDWVETIAWSPDQTMLASGGYDGTVRVWAIGE
jgi:WD40 repeat protein